MSISMKKWAAVLVGVMCAGSLLAGCGDSAGSSASGSGSGDGQVYNLKAYNPMPPSSVPTKATMKMAEIANQKSNGRLNIEVAHSGQLGSDREAIESTKMGTIDIVMAGTGMYSSFYEKVKLFDLPFLFKDAKQAAKVVNGPVGEEIFKDMPAQGLVYLGTGDNGMRQVSANRKIHSVADVQGLKIRIPEMPTYMAVWKSWGALPTPLPVSELYMSLKTGVVDAQDNAPYHTVATKCYEVQPNYSMINYMWMGLTAVINKQKYDSLPPDLQKIIKDAAIEACNWSFDAIEQDNQAAFKTMKEAGVTVDMEPDRDSFKQNLDEIYKQFSKEAWYDQNLIDKMKAVQ